MREFKKRWGLVIWDWYFGERIKRNRVCEKDRKRKEWAGNVAWTCKLKFFQCFRANFDTGRI